MHRSWGKVLIGVLVTLVIVTAAWRVKAVKNFVFPD